MGQDVSVDIFNRQIRAIEDRFNALKERASGTPDQQHELLLKTFEEFSTTLEELSVAETELRIQNEELLETRAEVEAERLRYRDLFDFAPDGYLVTDLDGAIREANIAAASMLGSTQKHLTPKPLAVFIPEENRAEFRTFLRQLTNEDAITEWEARFRPRVGESFVCNMAVSPMRDLDGKILGLRWLLRDVTVRRRAEAQVRLLNAELEQRVEDRTAELSEAVRLRDELIEREQELRARAVEGQENLLFLSQAGGLLSESFDQDSVFPSLARLVVSCLADWCVVGLVEDAEIRAAGVAHYDADKEGLVRKLLDDYPPQLSEPDGTGEVVRTGIAKRVVDLSEEELRASARSPEHFDLLKRIGLRSYIIVPLSARGRTVGAISLLRGSDSRGYTDNDLTLALSLASRVALAIDNARLYRQAQLEIEERRRAEAEIHQLNDRLKRAMVETHHRVKNNLQLITGIIDMRLIDWPETVPADDLRRVMAQIKLMARIHDMLTHEAQKDEATDSVDVAEAIAKILDMLQVNAHGRSLKFEVNEARMPTKQVTALALIVHELVTNALKYSAGEVKVGLRVTDGPIRMARLVVEDDGPGFPEGFDPQKQANTGLDLVESLSRWDLAGRAEYENRPEGGGRVTVEFPVPVPA